jgi:mRNA interferase MazF
MKLFDIILVPFPFVDLSTTKQRPCLVLATVMPEKYNPQLIVAMMTSQIEGASFPHDVKIKDWKGAELPKPTLVRLSKVVTLDSILVRKTIGTLLPKDQENVAKAFHKLFKNLVTS